MMNEIVNLKRHRKRKLRDEKDVKAQENRRRFGLTKAERESAEKEAARSGRQLDGHKRDP